MRSPKRDIGQTKTKSPRPKSLLDALESLVMAVNRNPENTRNILVNFYEEHRKVSPAKAEMGLLLFNIFQARNEMERAINIRAGNVNLGTQVGTINAVLQEASQSHVDTKHVAEALKLILKSIQASSDLESSEKQKATDALQTVAEGVRERGSVRTGTLAAILAGFPTFIRGAKDVSDLWTTWEPTIKGLLGL